MSIVTGKKRITDDSTHRLVRPFYRISSKMKILLSVTGVKAQRRSARFSKAMESLSMPRIQFPLNVLAQRGATWIAIVMSKHGLAISGVVVGWNG